VAMDNISLCIGRKGLCRGGICWTGLVAQPLVEEAIKQCLLPMRQSAATTSEYYWQIHRYNGTEFQRCLSVVCSITVDCIEAISVSNLIFNVP